MPRNRNNYIFSLFITVATILVSCNRKTVYDHYEHTPLTGWEKNDTLIYRMPVFDKGGDYSEILGMRISDNYPFTSICIIVDNTIIPKGNPLNLSTQSDTITCSLFNGYILDVVSVLEDAHPVALNTSVGVEETACNSIALRG